MQKQDAITLKRNVEGEFAPQYWVVTGGEFHTMLDAVKALPFRKWQDSERVWLVKFDGIKVLREAGYTITRNPDVHVELRHGPESVEKLENGSNAEIVLNYRTFVADREDWAVSPVFLPEFTTTLHFGFDPDEITKLADEERAGEITQKCISEKNMDQFCHDSAIYKLTIRALRELDEKAAACYKEHRGKRSKEEHLTAVQKVWEFVCSPESRAFQPEETRFVVKQEIQPEVAVPGYHSSEHTVLYILDTRTNKRIVAHGDSCVRTGRSPLMTATEEECKALNTKAIYKQGDQVELLIGSNKGQIGSIKEEFISVVPFMFVDVEYRVDVAGEEAGYSSTQIRPLWQKRNEEAVKFAEDLSNGLVTGSVFPVYECDETGRKIARMGPYPTRELAQYYASTSDMGLLGDEGKTWIVEEKPAHLYYRDNWLRYVEEGGSLL